MLGLAGLIQTVPALALLALFYPVLLILGQATGLADPGARLPAGADRAQPLRLLPIVRNGVAALQGSIPA